MDYLAELLSYLLQGQGNEDFSTGKEEIDRAENALLLDWIGAVLEEEELSDEVRLKRIAALLEAFRE